MEDVVTYACACCLELRARERDAYRVSVLSAMHRQGLQNLRAERRCCAENRAEGVDSPEPVSIPIDQICWTFPLSSYVVGMRLDDHETWTPLSARNL